jgi:hypothetical protein
MAGALYSLYLFRGMLSGQSKTRALKSSHLAVKRELLRGAD